MRLRRVARDASGDLVLQPSPFPVLFIAFFALAGFGVLGAAVRLVIEGNPMALVPLGFSGLWYGNIAIFLASARTVRFDAAGRVAVVPSTLVEPGHAVPFADVAEVRLVVDGDLGVVALVLRNGSAIELDGAWPWWEAEELARVAAGEIACAATLIASEQHIDLTPRPRGTAWNPQRPAVQRSKLRWLALPCILVGGAGFLAGFVVSLYDGHALDHVELPLGDPSGITVDGAGRVYVASRAYARLQRYETNGRFDRAWHLPVGKGTLGLAVGEDGTVLVVVGRTRTWRVTESAVAPVFSAAAARPAYSTARDRAGADYDLEGGLLRPAAVQRTISGRRAEFFRQPWWLWLVQSPLPSWLLAAAGIGVVVVTDRRGARPVRRTPP